MNRRDFNALVAAGLILPASQTSGQETESQTEKESLDLDSKVVKVYPDEGIEIRQIQSTLPNGRKLAIVSLDLKQLEKAREAYRDQGDKDPGSQFCFAFSIDPDGNIS